MCKISPDFGMIGKAPIVGKGAVPKLIVAHYGNMTALPGSYSGVIVGLIKVLQYVTWQTG